MSVYQSVVPSLCNWAALPLLVKDDTTDLLQKQSYYPLTSGICELKPVRVTFVG